MAIRARRLSELLAREARAADLVIVGARHADGDRHDFFDPGVVLLRTGRPILVVPDIAHPLALRRVVIAWKDTRECRRAVRDALPFLQRAKDVLILELENGSNPPRGRRLRTSAATSCAIRSSWLMKSGGKRGPVATELLRFVQDEKADLIVAGGHGHSRLGEWIFGGVTHELLTASPVCCMLALSRSGRPLLPRAQLEGR